jgi:hypothetical protein
VLAIKAFVLICNLVVIIIRANYMRDNKNFVANVANDTFCITFAPTVPVLLPVRSAYGSFFLQKMK